MASPTRKTSKAKSSITKRGNKGSVKRPLATKAVLQHIRAEAKELGLSTDQYLRLVVSLSSSLRKGLVNNQDIDGSKLMEWIDNPVFLAMVQWISKYAVAAMQNEDDDSATSEAAPDEKTQPAPTNPPQAPVYQQPHFTQQPWSNQQFPQQPQWYPQQPYTPPPNPYANRQPSNRPESSPTTRPSGHQRPGPG